MPVGVGSVKGEGEYLLVCVGIHVSTGSVVV